MQLARASTISGHGKSPRQQVDRFLRRARVIPEVLLLVSLLSQIGCATPGVTKATGRTMDPPIEVIFYCLLFPADRACRALSK